MSSGREIGRLLGGLLIAFLIVAATVGYWAIVGYATILEREDNPRLVEFESTILRGTMYDRNDILLAQTTSVDRQTVIRTYPLAAFNGTLGYYSYRYGTSGVEGAYDTLLSGASLPRDVSQWMNQDVMHQARVGVDLRLSVDATLQQIARTALGNQRGAIVAMSVPSGDILSMVSLPTFDPNTLDADWESLTNADGNPFFNRVLQGNYQAGGVLQTPLMATAFLTNTSLTDVIANADQSVILDAVTLKCAVQPPKSALTLLEAYAYGCPQAFLQFIEQNNPTTIANLVTTLRLQTLPTIDQYETDTLFAEVTPEATAEATETPESTIVEDMLGQGQIRVNPLAVAQMYSAILNDGEAPMPRLLLATRSPLDGNWQPVPPNTAFTPLMTDLTARQLQEWLLNNTALTQLVDSTIGSHVAIAYSGNETQVWFMGFRKTPTDTIVVVVVLEQSRDVQLASAIGEQVLLGAP